MRNLLKKAKDSTNHLGDMISNSPGSSLLPQTEEYTNLINKTYIKYKELFSKQVSSDITIPTNDIICAHVARQSYESPTIRKKTISTFTLDEKISTNLSGVYVDTTQKICIFGLRGTVFNQLKDIASDAQIILDIQGIDPRVKDSLAIFDTIKRVYQGYTIRVCGHSLGGTLSYIVAKHRNPQRCVVFNPGVALNTFFFQMLEDTLKKSPRTKNTYTYKILGDIISTAAFVGHTKVYTIRSSDPLKLHAMDNFVQQKVN